MSSHVHTKNYVPARLREGKEWYLDFYYELPSGEMKRCVKRLNCIMKRLKTIREKRAFGEHECTRINEMLAKGWTPLQEDVQKKHGKGATPWRDVFTHYVNWVREQEIAGNLDHSTALTYSSNITILTQWVCGIKMADIKAKGKRQSASQGDAISLPHAPSQEKISYIYQLDRERVLMFLTWATEERGVSTTTRNNYRRWLRAFCNWCVDHGYLEDDPVSKVTVQQLPKEKAREQRNRKSKYIAYSTRQRIFDYFEQNNRPMLLATYLSYYCMIRPHEIMQLRIADFHQEERLLFISHEVSKNDKDQFVTIPDVVFQLMQELHIFDYPGTHLLFNRQLQPSDAKICDRGDALRDIWAEMRKELKLPTSVKFYDTKRTGITDMGKEIDLHQVQLQARHSSITMTERYIQETPPEANIRIQKYK